MIKKLLINLLFICTLFSVSTYADFTPEDSYSSYESYKFLYSTNYLDSATLDTTRENITRSIYAVREREADNKFALFADNIQITDFMFNSIELFNEEGYNGLHIVKVSIIDNDTELYGIIIPDKLGNDFYGRRTRPVTDIYANSNIEAVVLPIKFKSIEFENIKSIPVYKAITEDGDTIYSAESTEYFINPITDKDYNYTYVTSIDNIQDELSDKTPIKGIEGVYTYKTREGNYVISNSKGDTLGDDIMESITEVDNEAYFGQLIHIMYTDNNQRYVTSHAFINKDLKLIGYNHYIKYYKFYDLKGQLILGLEGDDSGSDREYFYDTEGNLIDVSKNELKELRTENSDYSTWAAEDIEAAIRLGAIPKELQCNYTEKITRKDFCTSLMATYNYITYTLQGHTSGWFNGDYINEGDDVSPFTDCDDINITRAYRLGVVAGRGNNEFKPDELITRQEAAVMLNNFSKVMGIEPNSNRKSFIDSGYFADWAREAIYNVSATIGDDGVAIMTGTTNNKFSPWMNYTREQAYVTLYRTLGIWQDFNE